jgi:cyclic beta-1,2-glucan synthetase
VALLPHRVALDLDAIIRVWYRKLISKRHLLEWTTTNAASLQAAKQRRRFVHQLAWYTVFSVFLAATLAVVKPESLKIAVFFLILWSAIPLIGVWLDSKAREDLRRTGLPASDRTMLRSLARKTWRFFDDFVGPETHWLPPDNYQMSYKEKLANRTSPTNIGLWMASALAAHDFGFLTIDQMVDRLSGTLKTIQQLELFKGHLLNWYNIETLQALTPRYVSTVDSGNLLAGLWTVEQGMFNLAQEPIVDRRAFRAVKDVVMILKNVIESEDLGQDFEADLDAIARLCICTDDPLEISRQLDEISTHADAVVDVMNREHIHSSEAQYWAAQLENAVANWRQMLTTYLKWLPQFWLELERPGDESFASQTFIPSFKKPISLSELTQLDRDELAKWWSSNVRDDRVQQNDHAQAEGWLQAFDMAKQQAEELLEKVERIREAIRALESSIDMRFLYDEERRLFSVGYEVDNKELDSSFYDLLASEARLTSYIAIARGDVPVEHWLALSRPYRSVGGSRALLSWTGTMFEYLMPAIFLRAYPNSLLDQGMRAAVALQEQYGKDHEVPWGISESAFGDLDFKKSYMYKAFGVPALGLKRGLEERLVVAPYASVLALMETPVPAMANLCRLSEMGMTNPFGLYEAIDFSRPSTKSGTKGVIVHSVMAHHEGMSLLALDNVLNQGHIRRRFHSDVRVESSEPLLYERIPAAPALYHLETRDQPPVMSVSGKSLPVESTYDTANTTLPQVQILSNGEYKLMITNSGGGYSQWGDIDITRWRADTTRDLWGSFCYLRDVEADRVWSVTYHPADEMPDDYQVRLPLDKAAFQRTDDGIRSSMDVIVSPEEDVELRRIKLRNISNKPRKLEITSYYELAMAPRSADRQHPAFQKLFIKTEAVPEEGALLARRRKQDPDQPSVFVGHTMVVDGRFDGQMKYETDRKAFIGRGHDAREPQALRTTLSNSAGYVLDPILSMRQEVEIQPGQEVYCTLVLAAAGSRNDVLSLLRKFNTHDDISRAFDVAWAQAQLELRTLRIEPDQVPQFRQAASHLLFPNNQLRPPGGRLLENTKSQQAFWAYGISGDLPIAAVTIGQERDIILVRQMLQAHSYWRKHGLVVDLLIINEQEGGYQQALHDRLIQMAQAHSEYTGIDRPGGVFVRSTDRITPEDLTLMLSASRVSLIAARGSLAQQLSSVKELIELPENTDGQAQRIEPSPALSHIDLRKPNGIGGFSEDGHEYIIHVDHKLQPEAPWINVIANPEFGTLVSEQGSGFTWHGNSQRNRLTEWSNDPVIDPASEAVYVRDEKTGQFWTPTPQPIRTHSAYRVRHGAGYTVFDHNSHGIEHHMTLFVPVDNDGGDPIRLQKLKLRNGSSSKRRLSVTFYLEWTLGENRDTSQMHVQTEWDAKLKALKARNHYRTDYGGNVAFMALDRKAEGYTGDRAIFLGRNGNLSAPAAMQRVRLAERVGPGLDPCAALRVTLELEPGQTETITSLLGEAESNEHAQALISKYQEDGAVEEALKATRKWWDDLLGVIKVDLPDESANLLLNRWLLYQDLNCRLWGRSAFYQSGGAFGFRDQLQDVMALIYSAPDLAKGQILNAAAHQFEQGDVLHWWHPPSDAGVRTRISDDPLWLVYVVAQYVRITADIGVLKEKIPFLEGEPLGEKERERYFLPGKSDEEADLYEHCRRALERVATSGKHGLPLIGSGDWNDGLNRVGSDGKGESVWLGWFLAEALDRFAELSNIYGKADRAREYRERAEKLRQVIDQVAWDGKWYLRAFTDEGEPVGASEGSRSRIFSLPQSWATLAGSAEQAHASGALDAAWETLVREDEQLALLFTPPFELEDRDPGYVRGYPPGVRENGGQYTHGALWLALALAMQGDGERAVKLLKMLNPIEHSSEINNSLRYAVEPYAVAADIYALSGDVGRGGWTWYTGSAGWMYRVWLEGVLGFKLRGEKLTLDPAIPPDWEGFTLSFRHGESLYEVRVLNPDGLGRGVKWIELDGKRLGSNEIELEKGPIKHELVVRL